VPAEEREEDVESEASEWELRERAEREEEKWVEELGAEDAGAGGEHWLFLPTPLFMASAEKELGGVPLAFLCHFLCNLRDRPGRRAKASLHRAATRGLQRGPGLYISLVMIYLGRTRVVNKQKKKTFIS